MGPLLRIGIVNRFWIASSLIIHAEMSPCFHCKKARLLQCWKRKHDQFLGNQSNHVIVKKRCSNGTLEMLTQITILWKSCYMKGVLIVMSFIVFVPLRICTVVNCLLANCCFSWNLQTHSISSCVYFQFLFTVDSFFDMFYCLVARIK
jgi:hypothetical protein